jgi:hypothetical protein
MTTLREICFRIRNEASPALREALASQARRRENLAIAAQLAAPASIRSAYAAALARSKAKPRLTIVKASPIGEQQ